MLLALALAAASPHAFVEQLYAHYKNESFGALDHIDAIFAPSLAAAIKHDARLAGPGNTGALDRDLICDCQDADGLRARIKRIIPQGEHGARALIELSFPGEARSRPIELRLVHTAGGWRVSDTVTQSGQHLLPWLEKQNAHAGRLRRDKDR